MLAAFVIAALAAAAVDLPADYLRRRAPATIAVTAGFVNAVLIIAMVATLAGTSVPAAGQRDEPKPSISGRDNLGPVGRGRSLMLLPGQDFYTVLSSSTP